MVNNFFIDLECFTNSERLLKAIAEDMRSTKGDPSTDATHYSYEYFDEYFCYLCMKRLVAEGYNLDKDGWCYSGYHFDGSHYKIHFVKYLDNGYEALEFLVSQFEFDKFYPNTYPTVIPLILRSDQTYILGNTIDECIYGVVYTDDRGIEIDNHSRVFYKHFDSNKFEDDNWFKIISSIEHHKKQT